MPRKAKFVTAVWGEAYIRRFASLALPSFLARGNLPALAELTDLEVVIMTRSLDIAYFDHHPSFELLRKVCRVRFVEIDDLVTSSVYGVTLTLAYARAVIDCGPAMLDTHFVFMNADFVLSDGSLRAMACHIDAGRSIVLAPSFRAIAEAVEPRLEAAVDPRSGVLSISPRALAALAMPHPHATTVGKTLTQTSCHVTHPNQFFWQVDENTLLGRYFLIFMLCLKPESVITSINCYCDYAFVPEMCPSGDEVVMGDSDEFFMLELQLADQEQFMLKGGAAEEREIVRDLGAWTTAEHRRAATHDIVFRTADLPAGLDAAKAEAGAFIERVCGQLGEPVDHRVHPYWISGVEAWRFHRRATGRDDVPSELSVAFRSVSLRQWLVASLRQRFWSFAFGARARLYGKLVPASRFNPLWSDHKHACLAFARAARPGGEPILVVVDEPSSIQGLFDSRVLAHSVTVEEALSPPSVELRGKGPYGGAVVYVLRRDLRKVRNLVERLCPLLAEGAAITVFVHDLEFEPGNFTDEIDSRADELTGGYASAPKCTFVGGRSRRYLRRLLRRASEDYRRFGKFSAGWVLPLLALEAVAAFLLNTRMRLQGPASAHVPFCSSVAICFEDAGRPGRGHG